MRRAARVRRHGTRGRAQSGASTGSREAIELRDGDKNRYLGKGVLKAVENINTEISEAVMGLEANEQAFLDRTLIELDGTENKARLGANAMLAVSMAVAKAAAEEAGLPLYRYFGGSGAMSMPVPMMNVINGGAHANNNLDLQEFMIVPVGAPSFSEAVRYGAEVFHALKKLIDKTGMSTAVGDEGGFAPSVASHEAAIQLILQAIDTAGYDRRLADRDRARLRGQRVLQGRQVPPRRRRPRALGARTGRTCSPPGATSTRSFRSRTAWRENDWDGWATLTERLGDKVQLVGDDLFVTNTRDPARRHTPRAWPIRSSSRSTRSARLTETFAAIEMAKCAGYTSVVSHRSGETEDATIADIAVGTNAMQIKTGSMSRSDRIAKYNQLLRIEEDLGDIASYPGRGAFYNLR